MAKQAVVRKSASEAQLKEVADVIKCCICMQTFTSPRTLPCSHTFCLKCLKTYTTDKKEGVKIPCPICRQEWKIPVDGVQGFSRNIFAEKLAELAQTPDWASKESCCDVCRENGNPYDTIPVAEMHCIECQQNMCNDCVYHHRRNKVSKQHEIINLHGLRGSTLVRFKSKTCEKHPNKPLVVYCVDCFVPICQSCFQESHSGHKSEDVKQRADEVKKQLEEAVTNITHLSEELRKVLNQELPKSLLDFVAKTEVDIHERGLEVRRLVDLHEKKLLEYLNHAKKRRQKEVSAEKIDAEICLGEMESFLMMTRELQEQGSISDISSTGTMLMSRTPELQTNYEKMHKILKAKIALPVTELKSVDIEDLLSYSAGNLIGKIRVNVLEKGLENDDDYYIFRRQYDDDNDQYTDCVDTPEYESTELYGSVSSDYEMPEGPPGEPRAPLPPKPPPFGDTPSGSLMSSEGNTALTEIPPSAVVLHDKLRRGKYTEIYHGKLTRTVDSLVKAFTTEATNEQWIVNSCDFFREAIILQKLSHPKIVNLLGVSTLSQPFYVITEYVCNGFLDKFLKTEKQRKNSVQLAMKDVINMAEQLADAMHYLETRSCIHRFLAAQSILVGTNFSLKLANFEMAVSLKSGVHGRIQTHTDVYELLGSPMMMRAPEVIESQRWSIKSDVWSFAIVIYEILTYGAKPYPGDSESKFMSRVLTSYDILRPAGSDFKYPDPRLRSIMESCWKKDPNERPDFKYLFECFRDFFKQQDFMGYMRRPKIVKALNLKGPVSGVTMYKEEIFIIRSDSTTIDSFNSTTFKRTNPISTGETKKSFLSLRKGKKSQDYTGLQDIIPCKKNDFIYVSGWQDCIIHRISPISRSVTGAWEVKNGDPTSLAPTQNGNLLVSCASEGKVLEYTFDGKLIHAINFDCNGEGPLHTVQLTSERFVACHGRRETMKANEGVTIIDKYGKSIPEVKPLTLPQPCHLAVDSNNNVLIAARGRNKLILWNSIKGSQRVLITLDQERKVPTRIHLNESTGQLLMLFRDNKLMIYQVKSSKSKITTGDKATADDYDDIYSYTSLRPSTRPMLPPAFLHGRVPPSSNSVDDLYEELH